MSAKVNLTNSPHKETPRIYYSNYTDITVKLKDFTLSCEERSQSLLRYEPERDVQHLTTRSNVDLEPNDNDALGPRSCRISAKPSLTYLQCSSCLERFSGIVKRIRNPIDLNTNKSTSAASATRMNTWRRTNFSRPYRNSVFDTGKSLT